MTFSIATILLSDLQRVTRRGLGMIVVWHERYLQRQTLARLDERMLRDIGLTPLDAQTEYDKPFWRA